MRSAAVSWLQEIHHQSAHSPRPRRHSWRSSASATAQSTDTAEERRNSPGTAADQRSMAMQAAVGSVERDEVAIRHHSVRGQRRSVAHRR